MNKNKIGNCLHVVWSEGESVCVCNDDDGYYVTEFNSREEVGAFIAKLEAAADEAFPKKETE